MVDLPALEDGELSGMLEDLLGQFDQQDPGLAPGDPATERDFWPVIRLQVSHDTAKRFADWWSAQAGGDDDERLSALMDQLG
jgi:hypothetical protein